MLASDEAYSELYFAGEPPASALQVRRPLARRGLQHAVQALVDARLPLRLRRRRPGDRGGAEEVPAERRASRRWRWSSAQRSWPGATRRTSTRCASATAPSAPRCSPALEALGLRDAGGDATFFLWLDAGPYADELAARWLEAGVVVAPGSFFGAPGYLRVALVPPPEACARAAEIIRVPCVTCTPIARARSPSARWPSDYDRLRPTPPAALVDELVALAPSRVLDVGCGTGKVAGALTAARALGTRGRVRRADGRVARRPVSVELGVLRGLGRPRAHVRPDHLRRQLALDRPRARLAQDRARRSRRAGPSCASGTTSRSLSRCGSASKPCIGASRRDRSPSRPSSILEDDPRVEHHTYRWPATFSADDYVALIAHLQRLPDARARGARRAPARAARGGHGARRHRDRALSHRCVSRSRAGRVEP